MPRSVIAVGIFLTFVVALRAQVTTPQAIPDLLRHSGQLPTTGSQSMAGLATSGALYPPTALYGVSPAPGAELVAATAATGINVTPRLAALANAQLPPGATIPRPVTLATSGVTAVSAGFYHTCAVTSGGGVKCWGRNIQGQLGDGTSTGRLTPVDVSGLTTGVTAVSAGYAHTCALTSGGGVKCWGHNSNGQLGDGTTTARLTPVDVSGLTSGVTAVIAADAHTCALTSGGGVKCWGSNFSGNVGDGSSTSRSTPVSVSGLTSGITALAASGSHTCALMSGGGLKCWGNNLYGQLGDGTTTDRSTPVPLSGLTSAATAVGAGYHHTCVLVTVGGMKCWGANGYAQLGNGTTTDRLAPTDVSGLTSAGTSVAADGWFTCVLLQGGGVKCWGWNLHGELGDGTTTNRSTPVDVTGLTSGVIAVAAGGTHACALTSGGGLKCWGSNEFGQLGDGSVTSRLAPVDVSGWTLVRSTAVAAGLSHTCALTSAGGVKCWGNNGSGQLGDGTMTSRLTPADVSGLSSGVTAVTAGYQHTCALTTAGGVKCWGFNGDGNLGDGSTTSRLTPVSVSGLTSGVSSVSAGGYHTCVVTSVGGVKCWGFNFPGQLGDATTTSRSTAVAVSGLASGVTAVAAGAYYTCALTSVGGVRCWGSNSGQLGDGTTTSRSVPVSVNGLESGVSAVTAGGSHTCAAIITTGGVKCWGDNAYGQLGDGTTTTRLTPVAVSGLTSGVTAVDAGSSHTCALASGGVKCWGSNLRGQVGDGSTSDRVTPVAASGLTSGATAVGAGNAHSCAVTSGGGLKCWGYNFYGELGDGTTTVRVTPVDVSGLTGLFSDDPLQAGVTSVKAVHITELRTYVDSLRSRYGLEAFAWSDPTLGSGSTRIKAIHVVELRTSLSAAYNAAGLASPTFTGTLAAGSSSITAAQIVEIRNAILAIY